MIEGHALEASRESVKKTGFEFPSVKGDVMSKAIMWEPKNPGENGPKGIVQIVHGMVEYVDRYDKYASNLCDAGYMVVGHDHIGHGDSVNSTEEWGRMPMDNGDKILIEDVQSLRLLVQGNYGTELPYFVHGHSMGSFIVRCFAEDYAEGLAGMIVEGTGNQAVGLANFGAGLAKTIGKLYGPDHISKLLFKLANGGYATYSPDYKTPADWISRNTEAVSAYLRDPKCTFGFSTAAYHVLFKLVARCCSQESVDKIPKDASILIASGAEDPVGESGKGPQAFYDMCKKAGISDVTLKLYPGARHEVHNELCADEFIANNIAWLDKHVAGE